ncbi:MAG: metallophosphoesterase [Bacteroidales bacterium]|jgi:3',5'-cyclic AMP phosphodiesterase CpdA|nr:metallophosphoesterase [Bacteroidales bacterium]
MNKTKFIIILISGVLILFTSCNPQRPQQEKAQNEFTFAFLTDIHVQREKDAISGFRKAITKVNELKPDFVITGGDLVMDALGQTYERADSLYHIYTTMMTEFNMPVFNTMGNHEIYGWYVLKDGDTNHPEYGKKMFENRIGPRFQRIDRFGWIIFILDSVVKDSTGDGYEGGVDAVQIAWLREQLASIGAETPIIISLHIPLLTTEAQILRGATAANDRNEVVVNSKEVIELFNGHNLKLVLQGHLHYYESLHVFGTSYVTGGSVAAAWWEGPFLGTEEGFLLLKAKGDEISWEYVDYGWQAGKSSPL